MRILAILATLALSTTASNLRRATSASWPQLFQGNVQGTFQGQSITQGDVGCITQAHLQPDHNWQQYTSTTTNSITLQSSTTSCHTVNTYETCKFSVGDNGVTQVSFDYEFDSSCYSGQEVWASFWIFTRPWVNSAEVDFIETKFPTPLNINFAGYVPGVALKSKLAGSIVATFSGSGSNVHCTVKSLTDNVQASSTLSSDSGYFFVLDTAGGAGQTCTIAVSNLAIEGTVPAGQCAGLSSN